MPRSLTMITKSSLRCIAHTNVHIKKINIAKQTDGLLRYPIAMQPAITPIFILLYLSYTIGFFISL